MDTEDLAQEWAALPQISSVHASGDGRLAYFCMRGPHDVDEVYAVATDGGSPPMQQTWGVDHHQIRDVSQNGDVVVLAQSHHASGHDHLMILDRRVGNRLRLITPKQDCHTVCGGRLTRDARAVIFVADYDYEAEEVIKGAMVWWLDIHSGARRMLVRTRHMFDRAPSLSPSGARVLLQVQERAPGGTQLWVVGEDGQGLREVVNFGLRNNTRGDWLDEDHIAFVTDRGGRDLLGVVNIETGVVRFLGGEPLVCPQAVVCGAGRFVCVTHREGQVVPVVSDGEVVAEMPNRSGRRSLLPQVGLPDGGWLAEAYDGDGPHDLVRVLPGGDCVVLNSRVRSGRVHRAGRDFRWVSGDGRAVQGWLYEPEGVSKGFICYAHGGPTSHSEDWVNPEIGFWVQAGYAVLDPNYRGSTGFGHDWREAVKEDGWGGREQADIRAGIEACVALGIAVRGRIAVAGSCYGGFSSWYAITRFADLVDAAIPMCGMYRLEIDYDPTGMAHCRDYARKMMGGTPEEVPEKYATASPGNYISQIRGAVMIVHGMADRMVVPENSLVAVQELTAAGIAHQAVFYHDEGHGVFRRGNVADYLSRSVVFLERAFA